jgi:hypothetical protein
VRIWNAQVDVGEHQFPAIIRALMNLKTVDGIASPRKADLITNSNVLHFNSPHQSCYHSVLVMGCVSHIFSWLSRLNLFLKPNKGDQSSCLHQEELQRQLHATRSYLILLIILLICSPPVECIDEANRPFHGQKSIARRVSLVGSQIC